MIPFWPIWLVASGAVYMGLNMNMSPKAPKAGLFFFGATICQGSAVKKVTYIYIDIVRKALLCTVLKKEFRIPRSTAS